MLHIQMIFNQVTLLRVEILLPLIIVSKSPEIKTVTDIFTSYQFFSTWNPSSLLLSIFAFVWSHRSVVHSEDYTKPTTLLKERPDHNTRNSMPYSFRIVCGFFYIPQNCEHSRVVKLRPTVYGPYPRRLESLTHLQM